MFDEKTQEIKVINDITVGKYDVVVVTGSTLPTNRMAQLEMYMDAYKNGIIDKQEVLKKTEVFDMEGVLQRTDLIQQLQSQLSQATETIKQMQGDLQTREREVYHAKMKAEIEKTKSNLKGTENRAKMSGTLFEKRLDDALGQVKREVSETSKTDSPSSRPKKKQSQE
jgi:TolA-binding protein